MAITVEDGKIVVEGGSIGTGQACCCKKCEGPCEENEDCAPGCRCVDGECVEECSGPCSECEEPDFACSVIFVDTEEEANNFCQDPTKVFRNCDIFGPGLSPFPDQGDRWAIDYCACTPSPCPEGCVCVDGECVEPPCSGPCDTNEDCDPGCRCDGGECVPCASIDGGSG